jgi:hypothetical protein
MPAPIDAASMPKTLMVADSTATFCLGAPFVSKWLPGFKWQPARAGVPASRNSGAELIRMSFWQGVPTHGFP